MTSQDHERVSFRSGTLAAPALSSVQFLASTVAGIIREMAAALACASDGVDNQSDSFLGSFAA